MPDLARLSINQICVLPQWSLAQAIEGLARHRVPAISVWREKLHELGVAEAKKRIDGAGLAVSGLCFAGLISSAEAAEAAKARDDVRRALDEAAGIGAACLVFLSGGVDARDKDLAATRARKPHPHASPRYFIEAFVAWVEGAPQVHLSPLAGRGRPPEAAG